MPTLQKEKLVSALKKQLENTNSIIFTNFQGMDVGNLSKLRNALAEQNVVYQVVKNNLIRIALEASEYSGLDSILVGPTAVAFVGEDIVTASKIINDFKKETEFLKIKGGFVDGENITRNDIEAYAKLPTKEEMFASILGALQSPIGGVVNCLGDPISSLVRALDAVSGKKES